MSFESKRFKQIWAVDFEFFGLPGDRPTPVCVVARELKSGQKLRLWQDKLNKMKQPPYATDKDALFIAYYASAEISCHLVLNWPVPLNILDLFTEFRNNTNGLKLPFGSGLIGALAWYGINGMSALQKDAMRDLVLTGGPWNAEEKEAILNYCEDDVRALSLLLEKMASSLDLDRALLRGRYMAASAKIEHAGVPVDTESLNLLQGTWGGIKTFLVSEIDRDYGIYEDGHFRTEKFAKWLVENNIPWPRLDSGVLDLKDDTFKEMARTYPKIAPLRELRVALSQLRLSDLAVGKDGRNRCLLSAFRAKTGRNTPSNVKFIFGPAVWLRSLIKPEPGVALAYIDWCQQEFGIAAKLSGDFKMMDAYKSDDPYLGFAKQAGAVPLNATKQSHYQERENFKACVLGVHYGMGEQALAVKIRQPVAVARELLALHRETYRDFWRWSDGAQDYAMFYSKLWTTFGWTIHISGDKPNPRMLRNFLIQANGAEMLRLAICLMIEHGVTVCAPVHDAVLVEAPVDQIQDKVKIAQNCMAEASRIVLDGFGLGSDVELITYPDRYMDKRGQQMWNTISGILAELSR
jgi:hypothetical protein